MAAALHERQSLRDRGGELCYEERVNGIHDLGGMDGFGPVTVESDEPVFHHRWEARVFGSVASLAAARFTNTHEFRHAIERMDPLHYLDSSYYEHWLTAAATLLVEKGIASRAELEAGGSFPLSRPAGVAAPPSVADETPARFGVGDIVVVRNINPLGHTRCPRYVRGKRGTVIRVDPAFVVPDVASRGVRAPKQPTYGVRFEARELWGPDAGGAEAVYVDLWETYLEVP
jgi:nitrile hydratase